MIAAVLLGGAAWFSFQNKTTIETKVAELGQEKETLKAREESLEKTNADIDMVNQQIMSLKDETEKLQVQKSDLDNQLLQAESDRDELIAQRESAAEQLEKDREVIKEFPDIESLRRQMADKRVAIEESEIELSKAEGQKAAEEVAIEQLSSVAAEYQALRTDQEAGIIRGEFQSSIAKAYNKWGFVVVNSGNDQGVVDTAQLDVYRRGQFICKLLVTKVEANQAVADIIPGSLQPGQSVLAGDTVVKAIKSQTQAVAPVIDGAGAGGGAAAPSAPAGGGDAGMGDGGGDPFGGGGGDDPFGGGGGGGMSDDPFGGGGGDDPFGGGGGGGMSDDPFGGGGGEPDPFQ